MGVKRTSACALHMSAFDPKRTSVKRSEPNVGTLFSVGLSRYYALS